MALVGCVCGHAWASHRFDYALEEPAGCQVCADGECPSVGRFFSAPEPEPAPATTEAA